MWHIGLIGLAAGAASALLFASFTSGSLLAVPLFYLSPLPIFIAALGWSHLAAMAATFVAAAALAIVFSGIFSLSFLLGVGLPAWWLGYLALLARPGAEGGQLEWYPVGRLLIWAASLAAAIVVFVIFSIAGDIEELRAFLRKAFEPLVARDPRLAPPSSDGQGRRVLRALLTTPELFLPPVAAVVTTLITVFSLWLAGRIVRASGRLRRPWPELPALTIPPTVLIAVAIAMLGTYLLSGMPRVVAVAFTAALLTASALLGLAVLHALTRSLSARGLLLGGLYAILIVFGWPLIFVAVLGLADIAFNLRERLGRPPATPHI